MNIDGATPLATLPATAYGIHTSVYDGDLTNAQVPAFLKTAGIALLRYPGGLYSDFYHWYNYTLVPQQQPGAPGPCNQQPGKAPAANCGYLAVNSDFGHFVQVLASSSTVGMITVNYGSNPIAGGPATPQEAAAWVAYANGDPSNPTVIGVDATGQDWKTVSYWASLRAATPLGTDDGMNFLRLGRSTPVGVQYWEIGNELYGNGYYGAPGWEEDLHAPYNTSGSANRVGNAALSPQVYGTNVLAFIAAMKAVDPTIKIGAVLDMNLNDSWFNDWNTKVLEQCATAIDFGILHYYPNQVVNGVVDPVATLADPNKNIASELNSIRALLQKYGGAAAAAMPLAATETGPVSYTATINDPTIQGLFATDAYLTLLENGFFNIDWLELHNGTFLTPTPNQGPGPAYYGIQLSHLAAGPGDTLIQTVTTIDVSGVQQVRAHAAKRGDGSVAVTLINDDPVNTAAFQLNFTGLTLGSTAVRYDWGKGVTPPAAALVPTAVSNPGNGMLVSVPPYSVTTVAFQN